MTTEELNRQRVAAVQEIVDHMEPGWVVHEPTWYGVGITKSHGIVEGWQLVITFRFNGDENVRPTKVDIPEMGYMLPYELLGDFNEFRKDVQKITLGQRMKPQVAAEKTSAILSTYHTFFSRAEEYALKKMQEKKDRADALRLIIPSEYDYKIFVKGLNEQSVDVGFTNKDGEDVDASATVYPGSTRFTIHDASPEFLAKIMAMMFKEYEVVLHDRD